MLLVRKVRIEGARLKSTAADHYRSEAESAACQCLTPTFCKWPTGYTAERARLLSHAAPVCVAKQR